MRARVVALLFYKRKYQIIFKFQPSFVVPYHSHMYPKWILYLPLFPCLQTVNGRSHCPNRICYLGNFFRLSPFCTCNNQLQGITTSSSAPPLALLFFAQFCEAVGFIDAFGSPVIILKRKWQISSVHELKKIMKQNINNIIAAGDQTSLYP